MGKISNTAFQIISRIPFVGDVPILANTVRRTIPRVANGQWRHAAAEVVSGVSQFLLDDAIPVVGRDLGQELTRLAFGQEYLEPSLILGKAFQKLHDQRPKIISVINDKVRASRPQSSPEILPPKKHL